MSFKDKLLQELTGDILPFWEKCADFDNGGFIGEIAGDGRRIAEADKGAVLNGRILWAFSAAYGALGDPEYLRYASRAARYLIDNFIDEEYGGVYWSLDYRGRPKETKKQFYALGFAIYGLSEYARVTAPSFASGRVRMPAADTIFRMDAVTSQEALDKAVQLFHDIEAHSYNPVSGGYVEALTRDWKPLADMRLSDKDENFALTMNTHLHIIEPYTNLYRIWPDPLLHERILGLLDIFFDKIENPATHHLGLFFDDSWHVQDSAESYGHDIEASWLLLETAQTLAACSTADFSQRDSQMLEKARTHTLDIAKAALEGLQPDGSMINEHRADGTYDRNSDWWVQAETVIGTLWLAKFHDIPEGLQMSERAFDFIMNNLRDLKGGEWFWSLRPDGTPNTSDDKAGFWKCPYHNSRMCLFASSLL